jgi:energy-coupling factor transport system ATP-binding protein
MLAVASILAAQPPILVVDEPTTGLDYGESLTMMNVLRDYRRSGGTLVVITHDIEVAMNLGDRIVAMRDGRIVLDIPVSDVSDYLDELAGCGVLLPDLQVIVHELGLPRSVRTVTEAAAAILDQVARGGASEQARR